MPKKFFATDGLVTHFAFDAGMMLGGSIALTVLVLIAGAIHTTMGIGIAIASVLCALYLIWFVIFGALVIEKIHKIEREPSIHLSWACFKAGLHIAIRVPYWMPRFTYLVLRIIVKNGLKRPRLRDLPTSDINRDIDRELAYSQ